MHFFKFAYLQNRYLHTKEKQTYSRLIKQLSGESETEGKYVHKCKYRKKLQRIYSESTI